MGLNYYNERDAAGVLAKFKQLGSDQLTKLTRAVQEIMPDLLEKNERAATSLLQEGVNMSEVIKMIFTAGAVTGIFLASGESWINPEVPKLQNVFKFPPIQNRKVN